ncbi:MAG: DUF3626 domain-containing protein [Rickettsiaceae bacterium]|nr:DUF3626 domain-containing protein [Rickettsiaceae bacterium]
MQKKNSNLTNAQQIAIEYVKALSHGGPIDKSMRITLHFHPDRTSYMGHILESMVLTNLYKSQFETSTSNGGLTAHPGGDRWNWESRIFGTAYDNVSPMQRPKYGSLNYRKDFYGGSPRFGSAYIRLKPAVLTRSTFCYPDSVFEPGAFGTSEHMSLVSLAKQDDMDLLDDYVEAQVHGDIIVSRDVEAIVLDPSYKGTAVEELSSKLSCLVEWHSGYELTIADLEKHPNFRGSEFVEIGKEIAKDGRLNPKILGKATTTGNYNEQDLKKVWHYIARFGRYKQV